MAWSSSINRSVAKDPAHISIDSVLPNSVNVLYHVHH